MKIKEELFAHLRNGFYVSAAEMVEIIGTTGLNHEHVKQWLTQCGLSGYEIKDGPSTDGWTFIAPSRTASRTARSADGRGTRPQRSRVAPDVAALLLRQPQLHPRSGRIAIPARPGHIDSKGNEISPTKTRRKHGRSLSRC
jgi:hypothetical protein